VFVNASRFAGDDPCSSASRHLLNQPYHRRRRFVSSKLLNSDQISSVLLFPDDCMRSSLSMPDLIVSQKKNGLQEVGIGNRRNFCI
jgi:hypothetical protein